MLLSTGAYLELFSLIPNLKVNHLLSREVGRTQFSKILVLSAGKLNNESVISRRCLRYILITTQFYVFLLQLCSTRVKNIPACSSEQKVAAIYSGSVGVLK